MPLVPIPNVGVTKNMVFLNARVPPTPDDKNVVGWTIPPGKRFILTDLVVQNRSAADLPVKETDFTRFSINSPAAGGANIFFHVVGNSTLSEHFITGLPLVDGFMFYNFKGSTAPFVEFHITGRLEKI